MPPAARNPFEKGFLDLLKLFIKKKYFPDIEMHPYLL